MLNQTGQIAAAQLAIALILVPATFFNLLKHSKNGFVGWTYLNIFLLLRIVGCALIIHVEIAHSNPTTAATISGIGLSPLILAFVGILYESNCVLLDSKPYILQYTPTLVLDFTVVTAIALVVVGYQPKTKNPAVFQKIGFSVFLVVLFIAIGLVVLSWKCRKSSGRKSKLLDGLTLALPFLAVRVIYSFASAFKTSINSFTGPIAYRIVLSICMEFIMVIIIDIFGFLYLQAGKQYDVQRDVETPLELRSK